MSSLHVYRSVVSHTKTNWKAKYKKLIEDRTDVLKFEQVFHVIIIPQYKEEMDIMTETLSVLASHSMAKTNYKVNTIKSFQFDLNNDFPIDLPSNGAGRKRSSGKGCKVN
jgi:hypothetical protein